MKKLKSPLPWVGGKRLLREKIISLIPDHTCYAEVFAGGAWVYWGKEPSQVEVINDIDSNLTNLYKHIQKDPEAFYEKVWCLLSSREEYHRYIKILKEKPHELSDLDRAVYYFHIIKNAFGGRFDSGFAFSKVRPPRSRITYETLIGLSERLQNTYIDNLPYDRIIKNYDSKDTFFYCDPPYVVADGKTYYKHSFTEEMHIDLRDRLANIEGKFLLSYDDVPLIRKLYKGFKIEETEPVRYTLSQKHQYKRELLIRNY